MKKHVNKQTSGIWTISYDRCPGMFRGKAALQGRVRLTSWRLPLAFAQPAAQAAIQPSSLPAT